MIDAARPSLNRPARLSQDQHMCFSLAGEWYGVELPRIRSVQPWTAPTLIEGAPDYVPGIARLGTTRGPLVDLRIRFGLPPAAYGRSTVVAVMRVSLPGDSQSRTLGLIVDSVSDIQTVSESAIIPPPAHFSGIDLSFVRGVAPLRERMLILLCIDRILSYEELRPVFCAAEASHETPHRSVVSSAYRPYHS